MIVTAQLDEATFAYFDGLRRSHFPPERNFLSAHLTLFHNLPGEKEPDVKADLRSATTGLTEIELAFTGWRSLGRGVAMNIESPGLAGVRDRIARRWRDELSAQDRQPFRPHVTVQNKVEPDTARSLLEELKAGPFPRTGSAVALQLWEYLGGPWALLESFPFEG